MTKEKPAVTKGLAAEKPAVAKGPAAEKPAVTKGPAAEKPTMVDNLYKTLNDRYYNIYFFVMHYNDYIYSSHKYDNSNLLSMLDVHTLSYIEDNPGTTPLELIKYWDKTKGAISQILTRLSAQGLIEKRKEDGNAKNLHLYVTPQGAKTSKAHKMYDIKDIAKTMSELQEKCSPEEIEIFYKVIGVYNEVIKKDFEINKNKKANSSKMS